MYEGTDVAIDTMEDNGGDENRSLPYASSAVIFDSAQTSYNFEIGFIKAGDYTISVTCDTEDDPDIDDEVRFITAQNVTVISASTPIAVNF